MGQLFNRISTGWFDEQTPAIILPNSFRPTTPIITKRKRIDQENFSKKKRISTNDVYLSLPTRLIKSSKYRALINHSFSSMILFKCQLCCRCFSSKDCYLDHMIICAIERHASIKIVRAKKNEL